MNILVVIPFFIGFLFAEQPVQTQSRRPYSWQDNFPSFSFTENHLENYFSGSDASPEERRAFIIEMMNKIAERNGRKSFDVTSFADVASLTQGLSHLLGVRDVALHNIEDDSRSRSHPVVADVDMYGRMNLNLDHSHRGFDDTALAAAILRGIVSMKRHHVLRQLMTRFGVTGLLTLAAGAGFNLLSTKTPLLSAIALLVLTSLFDQLAGKRAGEFMKPKYKEEADAAVKEWGL